MTSIVNTNMPISISKLSIASSSASLINDLIANMSDLTTTAPSRHDIFNEIKLKNKIIVFLYDVHNSHTSSASYHRLAQAATFPFYLGQPHFTPSEVKYLTSMEVNHGITLGDIIKSTLHVGNQRRQEMVDIDRVPHHNKADSPASDLASVLERIFNIRGNELRSTVDIRKLLIESGIKASRPLQQGAKKSPPPFRKTVLTTKAGPAGIRKKISPPRQNLGLMIAAKFQSSGPLASVLEAMEKSGI